VRPTVAERLAHIEEAINNIEQMLAGRARAAFVEDMMLRLAVERSLEIISEASRHIPPDLKAGNQTINWRRLADLGNWLRHAYHRTDAGLLWDMVQNELQSLKTFVRQLIEGPNH